MIRWRVLIGDLLEMACALLGALSIYFLINGRYPLWAFSTVGSIIGGILSGRWYASAFNDDDDGN